MAGTKLIRMRRPNVRLRKGPRDGSAPPGIVGFCVFCTLPPMPKPMISFSANLGTCPGRTEPAGQSDGPVDLAATVALAKTEVAMRAAFVAAMFGLQVAHLLRPQPLLARQHY